MKIKMTTCAVKTTRDYKTTVFDSGKVYTVGDNIKKSDAEAFLEANFAVLVEEEEKPKRNSRKKAAEEGAE